MLVMTTPISDDQMRANLAVTASYSIAILRRGPIYGTEEAKPLVWEHGRRNTSLRAGGVLNVVCPVTDDSEVCGIGIFSTTTDELDKIMRSDPGVAAGVFVYDIHPCRSFPGDALATADEVGPLGTRLVVSPEPSS